MEASQLRKKKDSSKIKCFVCRKNDHYAFQCSKNKKGKGKTQRVAESIVTRLSEFATKFKSDFSLVSFLSNNTVARSAWYLDSGASHHMTEARELFNKLTE